MMWSKLVEKLNNCDEIKRHKLIESGEPYKQIYFNDQRSFSLIYIFYIHDASIKNVLKMAWKLNNLQFILSLR